MNCFNLLRVNPNSVLLEDWAEDDVEQIFILTWGWNSFSTNNELCCLFSKATLYDLRAITFISASFFNCFFQLYDVICVDGYGGSGGRHGGCDPVPAQLGLVVWTRGLRTICPTCSAASDSYEGSGGWLQRLLLGHVRLDTWRT